MWQEPVSGQTYTLADAETYCPTLSLLGYSDWRLPTEIELLSLVDFTKSSPDPTIDVSAFPSATADFVWSSTPNAGTASNNWCVGFTIGATNGCSPNGLHPVRCVRGITPGPFQSRYVVPGDGTVLDAFTGLVWQQAASATKSDWSTATSYCASLSLAGTSWRVPSINELATLVDFADLTSPTIDSATFPGTPADTFWTSSPYAADTTKSWNVTFQVGFSGFDAATNSHYVRCVH